MSKHDKLEDVKARLITIMKEQGQDLEESDVRLWKLNYKLKRDDIVKLLEEEVKEARENPPASSNGQNKGAAAAPSSANEQGDVEMVTEL